jgi:VanZ family protein
LQLHQRKRVIILKVIRLAAWSLAAVVVLLSIVPSDLRPETMLPHDVEHAGIFFSTGLAFGLAYDYSNGLLASSMVAFSAAVEVVQLFVPGRHARVSDFVVDAVAACGGLLAAVEASASRERMQPLNFAVIWALGC